VPPFFPGRVFSLYTLISLRDFRSVHYHPMMMLGGVLYFSSSTDYSGPWDCSSPPLNLFVQSAAGIDPVRTFTEAFLFLFSFRLCRFLQDDLSCPIPVYGVVLHVSVSLCKGAFFFSSSRDSPIFAHLL